MGVEREINLRDPENKFSLDLKPNPIPSSTEIWIKRFGPVLRYAIEKIIIATNVEYPKGFKQAFEKPMATGNYTPFLLVRHHSHPDGFIIARLTSDLTIMTNSALNHSSEGKPFAGFFMPLAQSLEEGQQNRILMQGYKEMKPTMKKFGLVPTPIVRAKDASEYEMNKDPEEEKRMRDLISQGYRGLMLFPEGTTKGGKTDDNGHKLGMQPIDRNSLIKSHLFLRRNTGKLSLFIPAVTFGGDEMLVPDNKHLSKLRLLNAIVSPYPSMATIKVGMPIRSDEGEIAQMLNGGIKGKDREKGRDELNNLLMGKVAELLPFNERGVYAQYAQAA